MRRFIRYRMNTDQGQRVRNIGFVKVEQDEKSTSVHIHGKGMRLQGDQSLRVFLFYTENGRCVGVCQGEIEKAGPTVSYCLTYTDEDTGKPDNYPLIEGIILENDSVPRFAAVWNEMLADISGWKSGNRQPNPRDDCRNSV